MLTFFDM